tara:strand:- start:482 stop:2590 length:2109 start_codon:yes stop_codon:yes gene_type:complete
MAYSEATNSQGEIESLKEFRKTKKDQWERWDTEFKAADKAGKKWHTQGNKTVEKYTGNRKNSQEDVFRLNLFHSNIKTLMSMMFGRLPEVTFSRTNMDFNDDVARVAGMMYQRMLNADIGTTNDQYSESLKQNLEDRMLPGLGVSRVRYDFNEEKEQIAAVIDIKTGIELEAEQTIDQITNERAPIDYVHWRDFRWSPCRTWAETRWVAFRTLLTRDQLVERFGPDVGKKIPLTSSKYNDEEQNDAQTTTEKQDAFKRGEVWEIWDKVGRKVHWWCPEYKNMLDSKDDPLGLTGFYPCPEPMTSNVTTTAFMPIPDYVMSEDLYLEVDKLESRISLITEAIKVVGVYDQSSVGVKRLMSEAVENELIPVDNWAMFAEKGGLQGQIDWLPIEEIANTLEKLVARRNDAMALLSQITGMADIMRGGKQAGGAVSATERSLEARFGSVRIQALQDEFAKYATDLIRLRAEVVSNHFSPQSIVEQSNMQYTADQELIEPAVQLIKTDTALIWRIQVKPESVAMVDYAQLKEERTAYITALATFMQSAAPLVEMDPEATPILLEMLKWGLAGFKGSNEVEGVLDQAIKAMQGQKGQEAEQEPPSDTQIKAQMQQGKQEFEKAKQESQQNFEREKMQHDIQMAQMEGQNAQTQVSMEADKDLQKESAQFRFNIEEEKNETNEFIKREQARSRLNGIERNETARSGRNS